MGKYLIHGGRKLSGEVAITGGKNAMLPILAASVLNSGISILDNCPRLSDAFAAQKILESIGCTVHWDKSTMVIDSSEASCYEISEELMREMRSSVIFLGSVLGRFRRAKISHPGGCELGPRPIDLHLKAFRQLGVSIVEDKGYIVCETNALIGAPITLDFPSVGATENVMLISVLAKGKTVISNAAKEPEIVDLQNFLNAMGAKIYGAGTDTIVINGVKKLNEVRHRVMPDRIVAGTYLTAAAITGGEIRLNQVNPKHLHPILSKLEETGCDIEIENNSVYLQAPALLRPIDIIRTNPHPGFPYGMKRWFFCRLPVDKPAECFIIQIGLWPVVSGRAAVLPWPSIFPRF